MEPAVAARRRRARGRVRSRVSSGSVPLMQQGSGARDRLAPLPDRLGSCLARRPATYLRAREEAFFAFKIT